VGGGPASGGWWRVVGVSRRGGCRGRVSARHQKQTQTTKTPIPQKHKPPQKNKKNQKQKKQQSPPPRKMSLNVETYGLTSGSTGKFLPSTLLFVDALVDKSIDNIFRLFDGICQSDVGVSPPSNKFPVSYLIFQLSNSRCTFSPHIPPIAFSRPPS